MTLALWGLAYANICTKFHGNASNTCWDDTYKNYKYQHHGGAIGKTRNSAKSSWLNTGNHECLGRILCQVDVDISQNKWTLWPACTTSAKSSAILVSVSVIGASGWKRKIKPGNNLDFLSWLMLCTTGSLAGQCELHKELQESHHFIILRFSLGLFWL